LGGLHGYRETAAATAAAITAATAAAGATTTTNASADVTTDTTEMVNEIENRLAKSLQLGDDGSTDDSAQSYQNIDCDSVESLPSYRDVIAEDQESTSSSSSSTICVEQQQHELLPKYNEVIVDCPQGPEDVCYKYNSLVRDRKRLFESIGGSVGGRRDQFKRISSDSELLGAYNNLVKNRKLLFEGCRDDDGEDDLDVDEDKDCGYPDDESTPSLQSISSGESDACKKIAMDLDSLSEEEDSDESGYVEAPPSRCPADAAAHVDKEKELHKRNNHAVAARNASARRVGA